MPIDYTTPSGGGGTSGPIAISDVQGLSQALNNKVTVVADRQLSQENYTTPEKEQLSMLVPGFLGIYNDSEERDASVPVEELAIDMFVIQKDTDSTWYYKDGVWVDTNTIPDIDLTNYYTKSEIDSMLSKSSTVYTNADPVPTAVGGITVGTTFSNVPITEVFDMLLYPYQKPDFLTFKIDNLDTVTLEVGETYPAATRTFSWSIKNPANLKLDSIICNGVAIVGNPGQSVQSLPAVVKTSVLSHTYTVTAKNTNNVDFTKSITLNWRMKRYFGVSVNEALDDTAIKALSQEFATSRSKAVTYDCTGGRYFYMVYPASFGDMTAVKVGTLDWNDYVLVKRDFINVHGVTIPVNIYRSFNMLNGVATVTWN